MNHLKEHLFCGKGVVHLEIGREHRRCALLLPMMMVLSIFSVVFAYHVPCIEQRSPSKTNYITHNEWSTSVPVIIGELGFETQVIQGNADQLSSDIVPITLDIDKGSIKWGYVKQHGKPEMWGQVFSTCSGRLQSPINIEESKVRYQNMSNISFASIQSSLVNCTLSNNGHTVTVSIKNMALLKGLSLTGDLYTTAQIHFHWSSEPSAGSEHAINGVKHAIETENSALWPILSHLKHARTIGTEIPFVGLDLRRLLSDSLSPFYRYHGSLTTPPCYESVIWTICETVQTLSQKQYKLLQQIDLGYQQESGHTVVKNTRPLQNDFLRPVYSNNRKFPIKAKSDTNT